MSADNLLSAAVTGDASAECTEQLWPHRAAVDLSLVRMEICSNSLPSLDYLRRLFTPGNDLWRVADPGDKAATLTLRCHVAAPERVSQLVEHVTAVYQHTPHLPTRLHVHAPATWVQLGARQRVLVTGGVGQPIEPQLVSVRDSAQITIVCCNTADAVMDLARHVREIGYRLAENNGWICMHASAADFDGRTVAVVGESGAGKTTMALALAAREGWRFLGNDRLMVRLDPHDWSLRAVAMPCPIRVNAGTLRGLAIRGAIDWELTRPKPGRDSDWAQFRGEAKLNILPCEWQQLTGTSLSAGGQLAAVLLPAPDKDGARVRIVAHPDPADSIAAQCMSPDDPVYVVDWLDRRTVPAEHIRENAEQVVAAMAVLPGLSVQFGTALALAPVADQVAAALQAAW